MQVHRLGLRAGMLFAGLKDSADGVGGRWRIGFFGRGGEKRRDACSYSSDLQGPSGGGWRSRRSPSRNGEMRAGTHDLGLAAGGETSDGAATEVFAVPTPVAQEAGGPHSCCDAPLCVFRAAVGIGPPGPPDTGRGWFDTRKVMATSEKQF